MGTNLSIDEIVVKKGTDISDKTKKETGPTDYICPRELTYDINSFKPQSKEFLHDYELLWKQILEKSEGNSDPHDFDGLNYTESSKHFEMSNMTFASPGVESLNNNLQYKLLASKTNGETHLRVEDYPKTLNRNLSKLSQENNKDSNKGSVEWSTNTIQIPIENISRKETDWRVSETNTEENNIEVKEVPIQRIDLFSRKTPMTSDLETSQKINVFDKISKLMETNLNKSIEKFGPFKYDGDDNLHDEPRSPLTVIYFPEKQEIYKGQWKNGKRHGRGEQIWPDGSIYQGHWEDDTRNGRGRFVNKRGDLYEGGWKNDGIEGYGRCVYINGDEYEGAWHKGEKHGYGVEKYRNQGKYMGVFKKGKKHGQGQEIWPDGSEYAGAFAKNEMNGYGVLEWVDGRRYEGDWKDGKMHGQGRFLWPDGRKYFGEYINNMKHGQGVFEWPDKKTYTGSFINNKMHGEGMLATPNGKALKGVWADGQLVEWKKRQSVEEKEIKEGKDNLENKKFE